MKFLPWVPMPVQRRIGGDIHEIDEDLAARRELFVERCLHQRLDIRLRRRLRRVQRRPGHEDTAERHDEKKLTRESHAFLLLDCPASWSAICLARASRAPSALDR